MVASSERGRAGDTTPLRAEASLCAADSSSEVDRTTMDIVASSDRGTSPAAYAHVPPRVSEAPETRPPPSVPMVTARKLIQRVAYLGLSFCLLFTGFNTTQSFVTTLYPAPFGFIVLCLIYVWFAVGSLLAPMVAREVERKAGAGRGETWMMAGSALSYVVFIIAVGTRWPAFVLLASCVKGLCSGLLWIGQGVWLTKMVNGYREQQRHAHNLRQMPRFDHLKAESTEAGISTHGVIGVATGVFFTLYSVNGIVGSAVVLILLQNGTTVIGMIYSMSALAAMGAAMMVMASPTPAMVSALPKSHENILKSSQTAIDQSNCLPPALSTSNDDTLTVASIHARMRAIWSVTRNSPHLRHLTPYLLCQGVNFAYTFGNYPNFITYASMVSGAADTPVSTSIDGTVEIDADAAAGQEIAAGLLFYGIGSVVGSFLWGKIYDRWNGSLRPLLYAHALLVVLTFGVLLGTALAASLFGSASAGGLLPAVNSIGLAFGLIDALTNAVINNSVTANCEPAQVPLAFAWYRFCFCIGFAVAAAMSSVLPTVVAMASPLQMSVFERYGWLTMVVMNVGLMVASVHAGFRLEKCTAGKSRRRSNLMMPVH